MSKSTKKATAEKSKQFKGKANRRIKATNQKKKK